MKFENTQVFNFEGAFRGMRNPLESWGKSDSKWIYNSYTHTQEYILGENDIKLAQRLITAGAEHAKFMRQIMVSADITAPLYWYKEFDTYKVGTVANSTSTMHKLASKPITLSCFEIGDYRPELNLSESSGALSEPAVNLEQGFVNELIVHLEQLRLRYLETEDKCYWKELIRWLPESWLQTRTVTMNYANLRNMISQRSHHKLTEWSTDFIEWSRTLPYAEELLFV